MGMPEFVVEVPVPPVKQETDYTCGPASLRAVFKHYGIRKTERVLARELNATETDGTHPDELVRVAKEYGLRPKKFVGMSLFKLKRYLDCGWPVILAIQAWSEKKRPNYKNSYDSGHYVVAIGYDRYGVKLLDPVLDEYTRISYRRLLERWHDQDGNDEPYERLGIVMER